MNETWRRAFAGTLTTIDFWIERMQLRVVVEVEALYEWKGADCAENSVEPLRWTIEIGFTFFSESAPEPALPPTFVPIGELVCAICGKFWMLAWVSPI